MARVTLILGTAAALGFSAGIACSNPDSRAAGDSSTHGPIDTVRVVFDSSSDSGSGGGSVAPAPAAVGDSAEALDVIARYYRYLDTKNFRAAYDLLDEGPDRPSYDRFVAEKRGVAEVRVMPGEPGRMEGAAGSRFVEVPVVVVVVRDDGARQKLEGSHRLRKSAVDGASAAQREWRISSEKLAPAR